jgi:hypothetical protein
MNRIIVKITLCWTFWLLPYFWRNRYVYRIRRQEKTEASFGHRAVWLCFDCEFALLPKNAVWNPDGTHLP